MKKYLEHIVDSFTDYEGKAHHFVIVAISETLPKTAIEAYKDEWEGEDKNLSYYIAEEIEGEPAFLQDEIVKVLKLGISICNPNDTFDEVIGKRIAESKAKTKAFKIAKNVWNCIAKGLAKKANIANIMAKNCAAMEEIESNHVKELSE